MSREPVRRGIPSASRCRALLAEHGVPPHIRRHSERVAWVARRLGEALHAEGKSRIDLDLVEAGALLHDIAKHRCFRSRRDHAAEGASVLRDLGFREVAPLVARHVVLDDRNARGAVTEAELLNYADKRVRHEEVVPLRERFLDLIERYGRHSPESEARIRENWDRAVDLERKIFRGLPFGPEEIDRLFRAGPPPITPRS